MTADVPMESPEMDADGMAQLTHVFTTLMQTHQMTPADALDYMVSQSQSVEERSQVFTLAIKMHKAGLVPQLLVDNFN